MDLDKNEENDKMIEQTQQKLPTFACPTHDNFKQSNITASNVRTPPFL